MIGRRPSCPFKTPGMAFFTYTSYSGRINIVGGEGKFLRCAEWITVEAQVGKRKGGRDPGGEKDHLLSTGRMKGGPGFKARGGTC